jgi:hypothetical protein
MKYYLPDFDFSKNNLYIALDTYDKIKGDHKLPFVDKNFARGMEFLLQFTGVDSARILVDDKYSVFTDIYHDYIPVYASKENKNGKFIEQKLLANRADELSVYAIGKELSKKVWFVIVERLMETKILTLGEFSVLKLTDEAVKILKGQKSIDIKSSRLNISSKNKKVKMVESFEYDKELFEELRLKRAKLAQEVGVPAYIIFSDKTLKHLANEKPHDKTSMLEVNGVGEVKFERYGEEFLEVINQQEA